MLLLKLKNSVFLSIPGSEKVLTTRSRIRNTHLLHHQDHLESINL